MKHIYTMMLAALMATASFAQPLAKPQSGDFRTKSPIHQQVNKLPAGAKRSSFVLPDYKKHASLASRVKKVVAPDMPIIKEQPEGTLHENLYGTTAGMMVFWGMLFDTESDGSIENYVEGSNGEIYLCNAMSTVAEDTWVKGQRKAGTDTIVVTLPQAYYEEEGYDEFTGEPTGEMETYYLWRMTEQAVYDEEYEDTIVTLVPDPTTQEIRYVLRNDSLIRIDNYFTDNGVYMAMGTKNGEWVGYCDYLSTWSEQKDVPVALPATAKPEDFQVSHWNMDGQADVTIIQVAFDGNDVYFGGLTESNPDAWVKGKIEGNKVTFEGMTYMGTDEEIGYHTYFSPARYVREWDDYYQDTLSVVNFDDKIVFDYDAAAKTLKSDGAFVVNAGKNAPYTAAEYDEPSLKPFIEMAGTPCAPEVLDFFMYDEDYGYGAMQVWMDKVNTDGNLLNVKNMYYNLFFDDELFTFYPDEYVALEEETTDIPYNYSDYTSITSSGSNKTIYYYVSGFETFGLQLCFKDGDKVYKSKKVTYKVGEDDSFELVEDEDDAIKGLVAQSVKGVSFCDLSGRTIAQPQKGLYLKTLKMSDGSQKTVKYIKK